MACGVARTVEVVSVCGEFVMVVVVSVCVTVSLAHVDSLVVD